MNLAINLNMMPGGIEERIVAAARAGFAGVEVGVASGAGGVSLAEAERIRPLLRDLGLEVVSSFKLVGWFELDGGLMGVTDSWDEIKGECTRRFDIASALGSKHMICCPSYSNRGHHAPIGSGARRFEEIIEIGRRASVEAVFEFMGQTQQVNTLEKAMAFAAQVGAGFRLVIDAYHLWRGGGSNRDMSLIAPDRIAVVHLSDADASLAREEHRDMQRLMPGDGHLDLVGLLAYLEGYEGYFSASSYKSSLSDEPPDRIAFEAFAKTMRVLSSRPSHAARGAV